MIAGIDLGTSSVKVMAASCNGVKKKVRAVYKSEGIEGFTEAIKEAFRELDEPYDAVVFSSQTGTYAVNGEDIISWQSAAGKEEIEEVRKAFSEKEYISEIGMAHPGIISYPLPRFLYIAKKYKNVKTICQLKDEIIKRLTGEYVTDYYTWRGLANEKGYSDKLLDYAKVKKEILPSVKSPFDLAGYVTAEAEEKTGIKSGTPVYLGLNDYYAGLIGMGVAESGAFFDITGTSEHIGAVSDGIKSGSDMVSSPYFERYVTYGVTASSGEALSFARRSFEQDDRIFEHIKNKAPIFLPYLKGMRMPESNKNARGVFFGISEKTTDADMAYAVKEGVAFSLYSVYLFLNENGTEEVLTAGGAAADGVYTKIKASLFKRRFVTLKENDTSALGACMTALVARGEFKNLKEASDALVIKNESISPLDISSLNERYMLFSELYESNKINFEKFGRL